VPFIPAVGAAAETLPTNCRRGLLADGIGFLERSGSFQSDNLLSNGAGFA
jgi:hypothetical protein